MRRCTPDARVRDAQETPADREYAARLALVRRLGAGVYGLVLRAETADGASVAVKLESDRQTAEQSVRRGCAINALLVYTPALLRTHGWFPLKQLPEAWQQRVPRPESGQLPDRWDPAAPQVVTVMELAEERLMDETLAISDADLRAALFLSLHALYVMRREQGVSHGDLHSGNLMVNVLAPDAVVTVRAALGEAQAEYRVRGAQYMPKLIDASADPEDTTRASRDIYSLYEAFSEVAFAHRRGAFRTEMTAWRRSPEWRAADRSPATNADALAELLMSFSRYFATDGLIELRQPEINAPLRRCAGCNADARFAQQNGSRIGVMVCGQRCARRTLAIGLHQQSI